MADYMNTLAKRQARDLLRAGADEINRETPAHEQRDLAVTLILAGGGPSAWITFMFHDEDAEWDGEPTEAQYYCTSLAADGVGVCRLDGGEAATAWRNLTRDPAGPGYDD